MKVEIWSDVACPWCYVGTERFERAVAKTGVDVDVVYRSFELDPTVPTGAAAPPLREYLARKFGDMGRVAAAHARLDSAAGDLGIDFRWSQMRRANTFDAHRLLAWSLRTAGPEAQRRLKKALLRTYFTDGRDVSDHDVLADLAAGIDLDGAEALALLESDGEAEHVRAERAAAHRDGINAVPTFVIESQWMLQGALETGRWVKALTHIRDELAQQAALSP